MSEMSERLTKLHRLLSSDCLDAILVTAIDNRRYVSGFTGSNGWLLITQKKQYLLTDGRYWLRASIESPGFTLVKLPAKGKLAMFHSLSELLGKIKIKHLAFDGTNISYDDYLNLKKITKGIHLKDGAGLIESIRRIKNREEISLIKKAARLTDGILKKITGELRPGITEKEISAKIHYLIESGGGESPSFASIVAFGKNSAMPHYMPGNTKLKKNDIVLIDMGSKVNGYCSDITRTFLVGDVPDKARQIYRIVMHAQLEALSNIRQGIRCSDIDKVARKIITDAGYGDCFSHNTGHSIGLAVHESPSLSSNDDTVLKSGMLVTVEPGIYIPGFGGVRIEDLVLVTEKGCDRITNYPKQKV